MRLRGRTEADSPGRRGIGSTRDGDLPCLCARWPLHLAAQDPADQLLRLRLPLLRQPALQQRAPRALQGRGGGGPHARVLPAQLHRRVVPVSGIIRAPDYTMEQIVQVARTLREQHGFRGYIHLKTIPEARRSCWRRPGATPTGSASTSSCRRSLPGAAGAGEGRDGDPPHDGGPAPQHRGGEGRDEGAALRARRPEHPDDRRRRHRDRSTILGPAPRSMTPTAAAGLLLGVQPDPRRQSGPARHAPPLMREHRLYQADWLMRFYGFDAGEIVPRGRGMLDLEIDPKLAWALRNRRASRSTSTGRSGSCSCACPGWACGPSSGCCRAPPRRCGSTTSGGCGVASQGAALHRHGGPSAARRWTGSTCAARLAPPGSSSLVRLSRSVAPSMYAVALTRPADLEEFALRRGG